MRGRPPPSKALLARRTAASLVREPAAAGHGRSPRLACRLVTHPRRAEPERRDHDRHFVCIPAYVQREQTGPHIALIRNISASGALILLRKRLSVAEAVDLSLHLHPDEESGPTREARASVVRTAPLEESRAGLWLHAVGVRFDEPLHDMEEEIQRVSARLAERFGPSE